MRRGRFIRGAGVLAVAAALAAPAASGATPREILKDYADNGRLDSAYSRADMERFVKDATMQGYPKVVVPKGGVLPGVKTRTRTSTPFTTTKRTSTLPFT